MSNELLQGTFINMVLSFLLKRTNVPGDYHGQVQVVKQMLNNDVSGLVDSLTDFSVQSADVDYTIKTQNDGLDKILDKWLNEEINAGYDGQVPVGIRALAQEYFKERWKSSSFLCLKILEWGTVDGLKVPVKLAFVDGESIHEESETGELKIDGYKYYLGKGKKKPLTKGVIFQKPYARWFDRYPVPYLVKRGIYNNYKIIESLKTKQMELLNQVIPYMLLLQKGTEGLALASTRGEGGHHYDDGDLKEIKEEFQEKYQDFKDSNGNGAFTRVSQFDEMIKHFIPDMGAMFATELFTASEKAILSGLGFVDIAESISSNRKESILNPTAFVREVKCGVKDFKALINELYIRIKKANTGEHRKYMNKKYQIIASPIQGFNTDRFRQLVRQNYTAGLLSKQTAVELGLEIEFATEVDRRKKETAQGLDLEMYPPVTDNREGQGTDIIGQEPKKEDEDIDPKDVDKESPDDKKQYDVGGADLEKAPFQTIKDLPKEVKKALSPELQSTFLKVFNTAFQQYESETRAFQVAWSVIKQIGRKNKKAIWVTKRKRVDGHLEKLAITKEIVEKAFIENNNAETANLKEEALQKQVQLLTKLLKNTEEN